MKKVQTSGVKFFIVFAMLLGFTHNLAASSCSTKLFSVTIDSKLSIGDVIDKHTSQPAVEADAQGCGHAYCNLKKSNIGCEEVKCPDRTA